MPAAIARGDRAASCGEGGQALLSRDAISRRCVPGTIEHEGQIRAIFAALPADRYPNASALAPLTAKLKSEDQFESGLQRVLEGLEMDPGSSRS